MNTEFVELVNRVKDLSESNELLYIENIMLPDGKKYMVIAPYGDNNMVCIYSSTTKANYINLAQQGVEQFISPNTSRREYPWYGGILIPDHVLTVPLDYYSITMSKGETFGRDFDTFYSKLAKAEGHGYSFQPLPTGGFRTTIDITAPNLLTSISKQLKPFDPDFPLTCTELHICIRRACCNSREVTVSIYTSDTYGYLFNKKISNLDFIADLLDVTPPPLVLSV